MKIAILSFPEILPNNIHSFRESAGRKGIELQEVEPTSLSLSVGNQSNHVSCSGVPFLPEALIHRTVFKFSSLIKPIVRTLESSGTTILNNFDSSLASRSKLESTLIFQRAGLPFLNSEFHFVGGNTRSEIDDTIITKPIYGSQGRGIIFHKSKMEAEEYLRNSPSDLSDRMVEPHLLQRDLGIDVIDIRAFVVGGRCIALMERTSLAGKRVANLAQGGSAHPLSLSHPAADLAIKTVAAFELDFAAVDLLLHDDQLYVSEIDAWGGFAGIENSCDVSVSDAIFDLLIAKVQNK